VVAYTALKLLHMSSAALSVALFTLRGVWMIQASPRLQQRWVRVLPHVIDSLFLASGISLALLLRQYPLVHDWLTAKVFALVLYIILGSVALRPGRKRAVRIAAFVAALAVFAYIVGAAQLHHPLSWWKLH